MKNRVRFYMTWTIALVKGFEGAPFSKLEDFYAHARGHLCTRFKNYNAEIAITVKEDFDSMAVLEVIWDIDLDVVPGAWHQPCDHISLAQSALVDGIHHYGRSIHVHTYHHLDLRDARDHAEILTAAHNADIEPNSDDYPVYRPEPHPDWPEASEVFLQDGNWFWNEAPEPRAENDLRTPAAGPVPTRIFAPYHDVDVFCQAG